MVTHNNIPIKQHSFVPDAKIEAGNNNTTTGLTRQDVDPVNNSASDKMRSFLVPDYIAGFHYFVFYQRSFFLKDAKSGEFVKRDNAKSPDFA